MDAPLHLDAAHAAVLTLIRRPMAPLEELAAQAGLYGTVQTDLGDAFAAWTGRGLAALRLGEDAGDGVRLLRRDWPAATLIEDAEAVRPAALAAIQGQGKAHVRGSAFQLRVWLALMSLPPGALLSYGQVAAALGLPHGSRAVGRALGENPVAVLIPCHRVIQATGAFSGYRWGLARKAILVGREMAE